MMNEHGRRKCQKITRKTLDAFCGYLKEEEKSQATIQKYRHDVRCFLDWVGPSEQLDKECVMRFKELLSRKYAVRSANSMLSAVNCYLRYLGREDCCVKQFRLQMDTFCDQRKELCREEYFRLLETARMAGREQLYYLLQTVCATGIRISELRYITVEALEQKAAVAHQQRKKQSDPAACETVRCAAGIRCTACHHHGAGVFDRAGKCAQSEQYLVIHESIELCSPGV